VVVAAVGAGAAGPVVARLNGRARSRRRAVRRLRAGGGRVVVAAAAAVAAAPGVAAVVVAVDRAARRGRAAAPVAALADPAAEASARHGVGQHVARRQHEADRRVVARAVPEGRDLAVQLRVHLGERLLERAGARGA
jgi:hypothetical protein